MVGGATFSKESRPAFEGAIAERVVAELNLGYIKVRVDPTGLQAINNSTITGSLAIEVLEGHALATVTIEGDGAGKHTVSLGLLRSQNKGITLTDPAATAKIVEAVLGKVAEVPAVKVAQATDVDACRASLHSLLSTETVLAGDSWHSVGWGVDRIVGCKVALGEPPKEHLVTLRRVVETTAFDCSLVDWVATVYAIIPPCSAPVEKLLASREHSSALLKVAEEGGDFVQRAFPTISSGCDTRHQIAAREAARLQMLRIERDLTERAHLTYPLGYIHERPVTPLERSVFQKLEMPLGREEVLLGSAQLPDDQVIHFAIHRAQAQDSRGANDYAILLSDGTGSFVDGKEGFLIGRGGLNPVFSITDSTSMRVPNTILESRGDWNPFVGAEVVVFNNIRDKLEAKVTLFRPTKYLLSEADINT